MSLRRDVALLQEGTTLDGDYWNRGSPLKRSRSQTELFGGEKGEGDRLPMDPAFYRIRDGCKVAVWYQDRTKYYIGTVRTYRETNDTYHIDWDDKKEASVWLRLREDTHTTNPKNEERWCFENELEEARPTKKRRVKGDEGEDKESEESGESEDKESEESKEEESEESIEESEEKAKAGQKGKRGRGRPRLAAPKSPTKKGTPKKGTPKKGTPKKGTPKKDTPKKDTPKKDTPKKNTPKKNTPKKGTPKKAAKAKKGEEKDESMSLEESRLSEEESNSSKTRKSPRPQKTKEIKDVAHEKPLWQGQKFRVYVWFNDTTQWYLGEVCDYNKEQNNYLIKWLDVEEDDEWVFLDEENHTLDKDNLERWCLPSEIQIKETKAVKKARGRPKKIVTPAKTDSNDAEVTSEAGEGAEAPATPKKGRGRPKKITTPQKDSPQSSPQASPKKGKSPKR